MVTEKWNRSCAYREKISLSKCFPCSQCYQNQTHDGAGYYAGFCKGMRHHPPACDFGQFHHVSRLAVFAVGSPAAPSGDPAANGTDGQAKKSFNQRLDQACRPIRRADRSCYGRIVLLRLVVLGKAIIDCRSSLCHNCSPVRLKSRFAVCLLLSFTRGYMIIAVILRKREKLLSQEPFSLLGGCKMGGLVIGFIEVSNGGIGRRMAATWPYRT